ncbi:MAG: LytTR family transcriptional regulator DNA-binding domain-containing protein [Candidatus Cryptobacteroides sp.]
MDLAMQDLKYLFRSKHFVASTVFLVLFSALFLEIYNPFSDTIWLSLSGGHLVMTLCFYAACIAIVATTWVITARRTRTKDITTRFMLGVILVQYSLISVVYLLFSFHYTQFTVLLFFKVLFCVAVILSIPYAIYWRYAYYRSMAEENSLLRKKIEDLEKEIEALRNPSVSEEDHTAHKLLNLSDSNGSLKFTIDSDSICYVESQDNYVKICYELNGETANYMLRCSSMRFEAFCEGTKILRCHRSYFINTARIKSIRYENRRSFALLEMPSSKEIPISKTYIKAFSELGLSS